MRKPSGNDISLCLDCGDSHINYTYDKIAKNIAHTAHTKMGACVSG